MILYLTTGACPQVRNNTAGAAIKTRDYTVCKDACTKVLEMNGYGGDTKSLYRRALANWRLGEIEEASMDLETILKTRVNDYNEVAESTTAKKAARKLLRQIEESEERAELVEQKMAKALAVTIPQLDLSSSYSSSEPNGTGSEGFDAEAMAHMPL